MLSINCLLSGSVDKFSLNHNRHSVARLGSSDFYSRSLIITSRRGKDNGSFPRQRSGTNLAPPRRAAPSTLPAAPYVPGGAHDTSSTSVMTLQS